LLPVIKTRVNRDGDAAERDRYEHPAKRVEIRNQRQDRGLGLGKNVLRDLDPGWSKVATPAAPPPFMVRLVPEHARSFMMG
jgi:hypothetical protein